MAANKLESASSFSIEDVMPYYTADTAEPVTNEVAAELGQPTVYHLPSTETGEAYDTKDLVPQTPVEPKKERPKWLQWAYDHKVILVCVGVAFLLWVGFKKGIINWK